MTRDQLNKRVLNCAKLYVENESTVREVGKQLCIPKTTVHIYLTTHLKYLDKELFRKAREILNRNKQLKRLSHKR